MRALQSLRGIRVFFSPLMPSKRLTCLFNVRQTMTISRHHRHGLGFQHQQRAIERVARFLVRDSEDSF